MALGREIQDFLGAFTAVDHIATARAKREYYRNKQSGGNPTPGQLASISPSGWFGGSGQQPGLLRRASDAIGITTPAAGSGAFGSGQMGPGGALSLSAPSQAPTYDASQDPAYDPDAMGWDYAEGGSVEESPLVIPPLPDPTPDPAPLGTAEPPIPLPPYVPYPGAAAANAPIGATPDRGPLPAPARQALPITQRGNAAPAPRKALNDQTRTAAYDPELDGPTAAISGEQYGPPASAALPVGGARATGSPQVPYNPTAGGEGTSPNARNDLENAIHGGLTFAQKTFHLDNSNVAVGQDPHTKGGAQALMTGVGAATPDMVKAMDARVNAGVPQGPNAQQIYAIRRLEAIYRWKSMNGDKPGADKAAFELLQYSAGVAAQFGAQAMQQYKTGDVPGAVRSVQAGYNQIPDGRHMDVNGAKATVVDTRTGKPVEEIQFTPEQVLNAALGLSNRSLYWKLLAQRVSPKASNRTESQQELDRARADYYRARTGQVGKGKGGGGGAPSGSTGLIDRINAVPRPAGAAPTQPAAAPATPPQGGGEAEEEPEPEGIHLDAPPDLKSSEPASGTGTGAGAAYPDSVLRVKRAGGAPTGLNPPPASAPPAAAAPAPSSATGGRQSTPAPNELGPIASEPAGPPAPPDPDAVPDREVMRNGDRYVQPVAPERVTVEKVRTFDEPPPAGVPKELLDAQAEAAKLGRAGAAARQLINSRIKEWTDYDKSYASRKKAFEANEQRRVVSETKKADADFKAATKQAQTDRREAAKEAHGYNLRPSDVQAIEDKVSQVYEDKGKEDPTGVAALGKPARVRAIAVDVAQRNKLSAEQALQITGMLTSIDPEDPGKRVYKTWGRDPIGNIIVTAPGAPPLHLSPHVYQSISDIIKDRHAAANKARDEAAKKAERDAKPGVGEVLKRTNREAMKPGDTSPSDTTQRNLAAPYLRAPTSPTSNVEP